MRVGRRRRKIWQGEVVSDVTGAMTSDRFPAIVKAVRKVEVVGLFFKLQASSFTLQELRLDF
jgi:hypothetical protein